MDEATAKMAAEFGKSAGKELVGLAGGLGEYVAKTLGTIPADLLGLVGADWLHTTRAWRKAELQARAAMKIKQIGEEHVTPPSESIIVPLIQAAVKEGRKELQELWANLLARAMTNNARGIRREFIKILEDLEPDDVLVFNILASYVKSQNKTGRDYVNYLRFCRDSQGISINSYHYSLSILRERELISDSDKLTAFGKLFYAACVMEPGAPESSEESPVV